MANLTPDPALNTYLGGRYGAPGQGIVAPGYVRNPDAATDGNDPDFETTVLCDPTSGAPVVVVSSISPAGVPTPVAYNVNGTVYAGALTALVVCDAGTESDTVVFCDGVGNQSFIRHYVKKNGQPTGVVFDTLYNGTAYTPSAFVTQGACSLTGNNSFARSTGTLLGGTNIDLSLNITVGRGCTSYTIMFLEASGFVTLAGDTVALPIGTHTFTADVGLPFQAFPTVTSTKQFIINWIEVA